jgi:hypothetical protein
LPIWHFEGLIKSAGTFVLFNDRLNHFFMMDAEVMIDEFQRKIEVIAKDIPGKDIARQKNKIVQNYEERQARKHRFQEEGLHHFALMFQCSQKYSL